MNSLGDMTVAPFGPDRNNEDSWHNVSWKHAHKEVQSLRFRIFRCRRSGGLKKLRNLQRLLINCDSNLLLSIRRVTQSKTPGVDGLVTLTPSKRLELFYELRDLGVLNWDPFPVKRVYIPRPDGRQRPIGIPTIKDRVVQGVIRAALEPEWEAVFEASSYGYRPGRQINDVASRINRILMQPSKAWVFEGDISQFFDCIDHSFLLSRLEYFPARALIEKWLKAGIFLARVFYDTEEGTPQGGVISPLLANICLHGLPEELGIKEQSDGRVFEFYSRGRTMLRFADDFVIFCKTRASAMALFDELEPLVAKRGLSLNRSKCAVTPVTEGFDFVGFHHRLALRFGYVGAHTHSFRPDGEYSFLKREFFTPSSVPSKKSFKKVKVTLSELFADYAGKAPSKLIRRANGVIRGWCLSKRAFDCFAHFKSLDNFLYLKQLRFIKRRHPNKNTAWLVNKYFAMERNPRKGYFYKWTFRDPVTGIPMLRAFWFWRKKVPGGKVIDYSPVKLDQAPDNPDSRQYFHDRHLLLLSRGYADLTRKLDIHLAEKQDWACPVCNLSFGFDLGEPIHKHHIVERRLGGKDWPSNLVLVHWPCHMKVHYDKDQKYWQLRLLAVKQSSGSISPQLDKLPLDPDAGDIVG